jgi:hypothetical protein
MLNSAYLIWFGLKDSAGSFHGTQDYVALSQANDSSYHDAYYRSVQSNDAYWGLFNYNPLVDDDIHMYCGLFGGQGGANNVAFRAGVILHESWHAWENRYMQLGGFYHFDAPQGSCHTHNNMPYEKFCDYFFPHEIPAFRPFGTLHQGVTILSPCVVAQALCAKDVDKSRFHSANQLSWEFYCDLIQSPAEWVTNDIVEAAKAAQADSLVRLINGAPMQCMSNRPMTGP